MQNILAGQHWLAKVPQAAIAQKLTSVILIITTYTMAVLTWQLIPQDLNGTLNWQPTVVKSSTATTTASIDGLTALSLFGVFEAQEAEEITYDAPKTTLRLLLTGLVASSNEDGGLAIIESRGKQNTYSVGEKIEGTRASLHEVHSDRAILANQGRYETLMLDGLEYSPQVYTKTKKGSSVNAAARSGQEITDLAEFRTEVLKDPAKIQDYLTIAPVMNDETGELKGYRLNPSKNKELFTSSGLLPNDLAVEINGFDLTNLEESMQALSALPEMTEMSLTVERNDQLTELQFALPTE